MRTPAENRLIVIGLDGATFDVLDPYFRRGALPVMAGMVSGSAHGHP